MSPFYIEALEWQVVCCIRDARRTSMEHHPFEPKWSSDDLGSVSANIDSGETLWAKRESNAICDMWFTNTFAEQPMSAKVP